VLLWGVQHSVMARPAFKRIWTRIIPAHTERATYVLASALGLGVLMAGWQPIAGGVWHVDAPAARVAIWAVAACGWGLLLAATFEIDHFALFGVKQPLLALRGKTLPKAELRTKLIYRFVRHPIQTGILVGMWATPDMTASHALFAGLMTAYVMVGLYFEERELVREFGEGYREYRRRVAKLIPFTKVL
jgi:protein-S-isoprenylcysteine O-methyltransferase Ste14